MALSWTLESLANHSSVGLGPLILLQPHFRPTDTNINTILWYRTMIALR
jgi:hypothetical protein